MSAPADLVGGLCMGYAVTQPSTWMVRLFVIENHLLIHQNRTDDVAEIKVMATEVAGDISCTPPVSKPPLVARSWMRTTFVDAAINLGYQADNQWLLFIFLFGAL